MTVAIGILVVLAILGFFVKHNRTFENANMSKWLVLSESQRISTVRRIIPDHSNQELLLQCVMKIAQLPDADKMDIRDAIAICDSGIKANIKNDKK